MSMTDIFCALVRQCAHEVKESTIEILYRIYYKVDSFINIRG